MSVGDDTLDQQHQRLLEQVNRLLDAFAGVQSADSAEVIKDAFRFLDIYIDEHFTDEERYMKDHAYPELESHRSLHARFIERYRGIKERALLSEETEQTLLDLENHLARWWIDHIGGADRDYAVFIRKHAL